MKITVICVGKLKETYLVDACREYLKRISRYSIINIIELQDEKAPQNMSALEEEKIKNEEGIRILSKIPPYSYPIALEIKGEKPDSVALSKKISQIALSGFSEIVFIIGGSLGLSQKVINECKYKLSFSDLTFPHQLMRVILLEQIYRSFKIINNEPYHK